jgi:hypothetical protein
MKISKNVTVSDELSVIAPGDYSLEKPTIKQKGKLKYMKQNRMKKWLGIASLSACALAVNAADLTTAGGETLHNTRLLAINGNTATIIVEVPLTENVIKAFGVTADYGPSDIISATYGTEDVQRDVKEILQSKLNAGPVPVLNSTFGGDPAFLKVKTLTVRYSRNREAHKQEYREGVILTKK